MRSPAGSSTIGTRPLPLFPVLSATSCSAQTPNEPKGGAASIVSLSRPASHASAKNAPSAGPTISLHASRPAHRSRIVAAREIGRAHV